MTAYALLEQRFGLATRRFTSIVFMVTRGLADSVRVFATAIPIALILEGVVPRAMGDADRRARPRDADDHLHVPRWHARRCLDGDSSGQRLHRWRRRGAGACSGTS